MRKTLPFSLDFHRTDVNKQWRLIVILEKDEEGKYILIIDIEDYH